MMGPTLHLSAGALRRDSRELRRIVLAHTRCEDTTVRILRDLRAALRQGDVESCVLYPSPRGTYPGRARELPWALHVVRRQRPAGVRRLPDALPPDPYTDPEPLPA